MKTDCEVSFPDTHFVPVVLKRGSNLSEHLTVQNSPVLFGCRTGICGTCLVRIEGEIPPPGEEEEQLLDVVAPGDKKARLACQLELTDDIRIRVEE